MFDPWKCRDLAHLFISYNTQGGQVLEKYVPGPIKHHRIGIQVSHGCAKGSWRTTIEKPDSGIYQPHHMVDDPLKSSWIGPE